MDNTTPNSTTFNVLDFIEGIEYPEEFISVLTDAKAAKAYAALVKERGDRTEGTEEIDAKIEEVGNKLTASALTFKLRGIEPGKVEEIIAANTVEGDETSADPYLVAATIVTVETSDGTADEHTWTVDDVKKLKSKLPATEYSNLMGGVARVLFDAQVFDQAVDAGFPGRRA